MELLINLIEVVSMAWFLISLLTIREHKFLCAFTLITVNFLVITVSNHIMFYDIYLTSLVIAVNTLILKQFAQNELHEVLFISCLESMYLSFVIGIAFIIVDYFTIFNVSIVVRILYILFSFFIIKFLKNKELYFTKKFYYILSLILFALQFVITHQLQIYLFFESKYPELMASFIMFEFMIIVFLFIIVKLSEMHKSNLSYEVLVQEKANQEVMHELYEQIRLAKHNFKNIYQVFRHYMKERNYDELNRLIEEKNSEIKEIPALIYTKNELLNSIVNNKLIRAYYNHLETETEIAVEKQLPITDYDLSDLLSNILDNAVENCIENGIIKVKIRQDQQFLYICVSNSIAEKSDLITKKADKENHGIGLKSIERIAKKYGGRSRIEQSDNEFKIYVTLSLNK